VNVNLERYCDKRFVASVSCTSLTLSKEPKCMLNFYFISGI